MLPRVLKWILVIILIPFILNLIAMWKGQTIISLLTNRPKPRPTAAATPAATKTPDATPPPALEEMLDYRAILETPRADLDTLPANNEIHSSEAIHFMIRLVHPGSLYLLHEREDGLLEWVNQKAQKGRAGEWLQVPPNKNQVIAMDETPGTENFLMIYVPEGMDWSIEKALTHRNIITSEGMPIIPKEAATKLKDSVKSIGIEMSSVADRGERIVTHKLIAPDVENKLSFYEFRLNHIL